MIPAMRHPRKTLGRETAGLWALLVLFALTAGYFSLRVPAFETPDEFQHYAFVQHVVTWYDLPKSEPDTPGLWRQQGVQAPLYYMVGAALTFWIDQSQLPTTAHRINPFARLGQPDAQDNRNYFLPHRDDGWPWRGEFLALHLLRLFSVGLGTVTVYALYRFTRLFASSGWALFGAACCAFIPQFVFISGAASNDSLVNAFSAVFLWQLAAWMLASQPDAQGGVQSMHRGAWKLGVLLAGALLAKLNALGLLGVCGIALLWVAWKRREPRMLPAVGWRIALPLLALCGWWFGRNLYLYGDPLAWNIWEANIALRPDPLSVRDLQRELPFLFRSFWGLFGWLTVPYPTFVYVGFGWLTVLLAAGGLVWLRRASVRLDPDRALFEQPAFASAAMAYLWLAVLMVSWLRFMLVANAAQGRYLFPGLCALALALALIPSALPLWMRRMAWMLPAGLAVLSMLTPEWIIRPAYVPPSPTQHASAVLRPARAAAGVNLDAPEFELTGFHLDERLGAGASHDVFVRLRAIQPTATDYAIFVHLRDENDHTIAQADVIPGGGLCPTSQWPADEVRTDRFRLWIPGAVPAGTRGRVVMGLYHPWTWMRPLWRDETNPAPDTAGSPPNELTIGVFEIVE